MSVDTHLKGKNLSPYRTVRTDGVKVLLAPNLTAFARTIRVDVGGRIRKRVTAEILRDPGACSI